jgi:hypothetical protein
LIGVEDLGPAPLHANLGMRIRDRKRPSSTRSATLLLSQTIGKVVPFRWNGPASRIISQKEVAPWIDVQNAITSSRSTSSDVDGFAKQAKSLAQFNPVRSDAEFKEAWADRNGPGI